MRDRRPNLKQRGPPVTVTVRLMDRFGRICNGTQAQIALGGFGEGDDIGARCIDDARGCHRHGKKL